MSSSRPLSNHLISCSATELMNHEFISTVNRTELVHFIQDYKEVKKIFTEEIHVLMQKESDLEEENSVIIQRCLEDMNFEEMVKRDTVPLLTFGNCTLNVEF
jgi:hypothetical protein